MVAPVGKTPRHQLTERERQLCLEAQLSDRHGRRIRRGSHRSEFAAAEQKQNTTDIAEAKGTASSVASRPKVAPKAQKKKKAKATKSQKAVV
ncbi:hypothetical protein DVH05_002435 [Phytophthora capsici]|nr:hypothetical protein DVH05_002435 [Phytophthora capsici]